MVQWVYFTGYKGVVEEAKSFDAYGLAFSLILGEENIQELFHFLIHEFALLCDGYAET